MAFDQSKYVQEYAKENIIRKFLPFNKMNPDDMILLEWVKRQPNFTQYIKALIRADYERRKGST